MSVKQEKIHRFFYYSFYFLLGAPIVFVLVKLLGSHQSWELFSKVYFAFILFNIWYTFFLMFLYEHKKQKQLSYNDEATSIIMPCFNEKPDLLLRSVETIMSANGNNKLIIIDDGSNLETKRAISKIKRIYPNVIVRILDENRGKRYALWLAIKNLVTTDYLITIDSDTLFERDTIINIIKQLKRKGIGAVSGNVRLVNETQNFFTRMIAGYYWVAMEIGRKSESAFGNVSCCSGCISGYKTEIVKELIDKFYNQTFFGQECTHSEDRHLTNLVLQSGYRVEFAVDAIAYTDTPTTVMKFMKQQIRWRRGFTREVAYCLSFSWKNRKLLFFSVLRDVLLIFLPFAFKILSLYVLFTDPGFFLTTIIPSWILFIIIRDLFIIVYSPKRFIPTVAYVFFNEFVLSWQYIYALFTVKNKSWITRQA